MHQPGRSRPKAFWGWGLKVAGEGDEKPRLTGFSVLACVYSLNIAKIS